MVGCGRIFPVCNQKSSVKKTASLCDRGQGKVEIFVENGGKEILVENEENWREKGIFIEDEGYLRDTENFLEND